MICRDSSVGAAGQTAPTNGYEPPLNIDSAVVSAHFKIYTMWHRLKVLLQKILHFSLVDLDSEWFGSHQIAYKGNWI